MGDGGENENVLGMLRQPHVHRLRQVRVIRGDGQLPIASGHVVKDLHIKRTL
jgi:DNA-nicking Smr family endonuclease